MHDLTAKAKAGELTTDDESLLRRYEIVNDLLTLLRVKATVSLSESTRRERN